MANKSMRMALLAGAVASGLAAVVQAADPAPATPAPAVAPATPPPVELVSGASPVMLASMCAGCHGTNGASVGPSAPIIAKSEKGVFVDTMKGYKSGEIFSTVMGRIAKGYSDEEIEQMAVYFNGQKFVPAKQSVNEGLVKTGAKLHDKYCEKCHSEGGKPIVGTKKKAKGGKEEEEEDDDEGGEDYYLLAGQWTPYLKYTLSDFRDERRPMPKKMGKQLSKLIEKEGDKGLDALWAYYASQQ